MNIERRVFAADALTIETREDKQQRIVGHAAVFNTETDIAGFFGERIAPGAFKRAIAEDDVRSLFNHDPNFVLGRNKAGTLTLREDETGLLTETMPPDTQLVRDLVIAPMSRGDITQMSFAFRVIKEQWEDRKSMPLRTILEVELFDISPVTFAAYPTTDVGLRSLQEHRKAGMNTVMAAPILRRQAMQRIRERQASR